MQKQTPLFLNVDLSPQPEPRSGKVKGVMPVSKTPTKVVSTAKPQPRQYSPLETQPTRQTSTIMSKADLASKRSGASTRSQLKDFLFNNIENRVDSQEPKEPQERNDKSVPKTSDFQAFYQRTLNQGPKPPSINLYTQSYTPPKSINQRIQTVSSSQTIIAKPDKKEVQKVRIYIRIKPINSNEKSIVKKLSNSHLSVTTYEETQRQFEFAQVFENATQEEVYSASSKQIVTDCVQGRANGVVLVYGQTGSGKTYTMGLLEASKGLIQIALQDVFQQLEQQKKQRLCSHYQVEISFIQVYLDKIYDLLNNNGQQLQIRESKDSHPYVQGCVQMQIEDSSEGIQLVALGIKNRVVASQVMNLNSSRSHTLLTVFIKRALGGENPHSTEQCTKMAFLDLAGSERNKKSLSKGVRLEEATSINESLSALGNVIVALGQPSQQHVPYRESKLTRILQGYLSGESQISLICTITKVQESLNETIQTLMFAQRCKDVVLRPQKQIPFQDDETVDNADLHRQIAELKQTIAQLQEQIRQQQSTQKLSKLQQSTEKTLQVDKEFNKFIMNILIKLKQYTATNLAQTQQQEKSGIHDKLFSTFAGQSAYQIEQFPAEIQQLIKNQAYLEAKELEPRLQEQCLEGNKEAIKELAKSFTQDIHYLVQTFKQYSELRGQAIIDKVHNSYRSREMSAWAKGIAYLLQTIRQQHISYLELWKKVKKQQASIAADFYVEQIEQQLSQILCEKGLLYKSNQHFKELIQHQLNQDARTAQQQLYQLKKFSNNLENEFTHMPDKYKTKIEQLLKNYGVPGKTNVKRSEPPPIFHSATVNISHLIQSRKYQPNPFNDISSLDNASEPQLHSLDDSSPIVVYDEDGPQSDTILRPPSSALKEEEFSSQHRKPPFAKKK